MQQAVDYTAVDYMLCVELHESVALHGLVSSKQPPGHGLPVSRGFELCTWLSGSGFHLTEVEREGSGLLQTI